MQLDAEGSFDTSRGKEKREKREEEEQARE